MGDGIVMYVYPVPVTGKNFVVWAETRDEATLKVMPMMQRYVERTLKRGRRG